MTTLEDILAEADIPVPKVRPETEETLTPSGLLIRYEDKKHLYFLNDVKVPSVTSVLGCLDKPALPWWGMKVGVQGVIALQALGAMPLVPEADAIVRLLTEHKLTVNHVRDKAGARGVTVHDALEAWAIDGTLPNVARWPEDQRGFVTGLRAFLTETAVEPVATEIMVGSLEHGFAGRYDLLCTIGVEKVLLDLKTTGRIYPEQFLQLEAYEGAGIECGVGSTDKRMVLRVDKDGSFELRESPATYEDFLAVKAAYDATDSLRSRIKAAA